MGGYYDEIEIEDMTWDVEKKVYHYPCPCGDRFEIAKSQLRNYEDIATCPSCSLIIRVIYDPLDFEDEEDDEEEDDDSESADEEDDDDEKYEDAVDEDVKEIKDALNKLDLDASEAGAISATASAGKVDIRVAIDAKSVAKKADAVAGLDHKLPEVRGVTA